MDAAFLLSFESILPLLLMETNIKIFENPEFGKVRIQMNASGEPMFCLVDVAEALDIKNTGDLKSRLNPKGVVLTDTPTKGGIQQMNFINEGNLYKCIFKSRRPDAEKFQDWVCDEVLPSIRKTGGYSVSTPKKPSCTPTRVKASLEWIKGVSELLNLNESSKLSLLGKVAKPLELPLPDYTPSKGVLKSASELLKERGLQISSREFNTRAIEKGFLCEMERKSKHGAKKFFKSITKKGLSFGENQVSPHNPNSTQPHWYVEKFDELLGLVGIQMTGGLLNGN